MPRSPLAAFEPVLDDPAGSGLFVDFDGTLSEIVDDPDAAVPVDGAVASLVALAARLGRVGVLSGRPLAFLDRFFGDQVFLGGLYGLEWRDRGVRGDHPQAGAWREVIDDLASCAVAKGPSGMRVEPKGLSLTLHYRGRPELADVVQAWAAEQASRSGLVPRRARMSVELHPPIEADKGTALEAVAADLRGVAFVGDDVGDLPAFDALDRLAAQGVAVVRGAVRSDEADPGLLARADVVLDGPTAVAAHLRRLAGRLAER